MKYSNSMQLAWIDTPMPELTNKSAAKYQAPVVRIKMVAEGAMDIPAGERLVKTPQEAAVMLHKLMWDEASEVVVVLFLDVRNRIIGFHRVSMGQINSANIRPAEVFRAAILANAVSIILAHNHPSGDPTPSSDDVQVTKEVIKAGKVLDIEVLDHLVIAGSSEFRYVSLKERGLAF